MQRSRGPFANADPSPMAAPIAVALMTPTPGIDSRERIISSPALRQHQTPGFELVFALDARQHHAGCFVKRASDLGISGLADAALKVNQSRPTDAISTSSQDRRRRRAIAGIATDRRSPSPGRQSSLRETNFTTKSCSLQCCFHSAARADSMASISSLRWIVFSMSRNLRLRLRRCVKRSRMR